MIRTPASLLLSFISSFSRIIALKRSISRSRSAALGVFAPLAAAPAPLGVNAGAATERLDFAAVKLEDDSSPASESDSQMKLQFTGA